MKRNLLLGVSVMALSYGVHATAHAQTAATLGTQTSSVTHAVTNTGDDGSHSGSSSGSSGGGTYYGGVRTNDFTNGSFQDAQGLIHATQNNGANNAIAATDSISIEASGAATQASTIDATVDYNVYKHNVAPKRTNTLGQSGVNAAGAITLQQNNGDSNSLASSNSLIVKKGGASTQETDITQRVQNNRGDNNPFRTNTVGSGSFDGTKGVITVQQNNGDMNALAVQNSIAVAEENSQVGQGVKVNNTVSDGVTVEDAPSSRLNTLSNSFQGGQGILTIQQNNGDGNASGISTAIAAATKGDTASTSQNLESVNTVERSASGDFADKSYPESGHATGPRKNDLTGSFTGAQGIITVEQNHGNQNAMSIATGVKAGVVGDGKNPHDGDKSLGAGTGSQSVKMSGTVGSADGEGMAVTAYEGGEGYVPSERTNNLSGAFNKAGDKAARGILNVRQNNGDNNALSMSTAVAVAADVSQSVTGSAKVLDAEAYEEEMVNRQNALTNAFNQMEGIATVQQNNGNNNVLGSAVAVGVGQNGQVHAARSIDLDATVSGSYASPASDDGRVTLTNAANNVFNGAKGILTLQQNNGNNNAIQSAVMVSATVSAPSGTAAGAYSSASGLSFFSK